MSEDQIKESSRPLHGVLIFQFMNLLQMNFTLLVLVPSTGFLYFNMLWSTEGCAGKKGFSSPPRGSYISISTWLLYLRSCIKFSSPPRGSYISISRIRCISKCSYCSRPLHGVLIFQSRKIQATQNIKFVLVPSTGFLYFNPVPYTSPNTRLSSPICGANPQMREISISNWIIPITKPDFKPIGAKLLYFLKFNSSHPHIIQLSLILCTLTDMRCQLKLQIFGMFMHNIIFSQCIFKHIIHDFYCITAKQWI